MDDQTTDQLVHDMVQAQKPPFFSTKLVVALIIVLLLGGGSGYLLAQITKEGGLGIITTNTTGGGSSATAGTVVGSDDLKTFKDIAEGKLEKGGIDGEGQFHLVRPGGQSQNVYMTSSIVDLSLFIGKKVKVWGETQKAQKAGWLMDVGRVEVLE
ncbi:MAG: hypothetical protein HYY87_00865 [Candidatus Levybacteria bacterium]|nr:hypothetical protein [Candidatus Levybacteria bacterium]MBI3093054.1 hypothetical protein [Candidatus Levybacteria bacterium]